MKPKPRRWTSPNNARLSCEPPAWPSPCSLIDRAPGSGVRPMSGPGLCRGPVAPTAHPDSPAGTHPSAFLSRVPASSSGRRRRAMVRQPVPHGPARPPVSPSTAPRAGKVWSLGSQAGHRSHPGPRRREARAWTTALEPKPPGRAPQSPRALAGLRSLAGAAPVHPQRRKLRLKGHAAVQAAKAVSSCPGLGAHGLGAEHRGPTPPSSGSCPAPAQGHR